MTISSAERKARAGLPVVRFMQAYLPFPIMRWLLKQSLARLRLDYDATREAVSADGVSCEWVIPQNSRADQVLLYLHGGGFVLGLTPLHLQMGAYLARKMGMRILMVDYGLAPKHPFPAALDDCAAAYGWLLEQGISAQNIVVAGDSAGGNLAITLLIKLRDRGDPLPAAAACLSPVTDLTKDQVRPGYQDPLLPPRAVRFYTKSYVGNNDAHDPLISPVFGNLRGLPPLLVHVGEDEILRDDAARIAELAKAAGVDVRLEIYPRMWHVWQLYLTLPQAVQSLDDIAQFLGSHLGLCVQGVRPTSARDA
jgi:monoterpene epsilon-lactone hydrolase